ncbi:MAG: DUF2804 domain-containing protein [Clostridiales bacterium]|nr:DUF2804 domain-containing protein [Candidatus Crickella caballi]
MRQNIEITESMPLLDEQGNLTKAGYAKHLLPIYDKSMAKGGKTRLKEWDYYYIGNDRFGVALTIADNSYMGLDSFSFLSFDGKGSPFGSGKNLGAPWEITRSPMRIFPMLKTGLPETSAEGVTEISGKGYFLKFEVTPGELGSKTDAESSHRGTTRHLSGHIDDFRGKEALDLDIMLLEEPDESMVICTPFDKEAHFYFNQKINCMPAKGWVQIGTDRYELNPDTSMGLLDWGRGVWTYHNTWYWGSASGRLEDGSDFGWNIGYGFGDTSAASENMLFYRGKAHKLSEVTFNIPMKRGGVGLGTELDTEDYTKPWTFTSDDGRFEMDFVPVIDRASCTDVKLIKSDQHQVFGKFTGKAVLDDGSVIEVKDFMGFAEKVENKW